MNDESPPAGPMTPAQAAPSVGPYRQSMHALAAYYLTIELGLSLCFRNGVAQGPLLPDRPANDNGNVAAVVFGSDLGLADQCDDAVADFALKTLAGMPGEAQVWAVGERVYGRLSDAGVSVAGLFDVPNSVDAITPLVAQILVESETRLSQGELSGLHLFYNRSTSGAVNTPVNQRLLPLDEAWRRELAERAWPSGNPPELVGGGRAALRALIREYLFVSLYRACAESLAGENRSIMPGVAPRTWGFFP